jgi:hypothetical protein
MGMDKEVIILTKSDKNGGYCVAGIDKATGEFIRLVSEDIKSEHALFPNHLRYKGCTSSVEIMDIVDVRLKGKDKCWYQPENYIIEGEDSFKKIGTATKEEIRNYLMNIDYIFYNNEKCVSPDLIKEFRDRCSLVIFKVDKLKLWLDKRNPERILANFKYNNNEYSYINITDHNITQKYINNIEMNDPRPYEINGAILIMSLGVLHQGKHFKLIANIIEDESLWWEKNPFVI